MFERDSGAHMRTRTLQRDDGLAVAARMLKREARIAKTDLVLGPRDVAGKLPIAERARNIRTLAYPSQDRRDRVGLGRERARASNLRRCDELTVEPRGDRL